MLQSERNRYCDRARDVDQNVDDVVHRSSYYLVFSANLMAAST